MADEKKPDEKKAAETKAAEAKKASAEAHHIPSAEPTPRPDPVGERNYALGAPVVRPEGEGTPGAMQNVPPKEPVTPPVVKKADEDDDAPHKKAPHKK